MAEECAITKLPHHIQQKLCHTRPLYRQGKRLTSVKVASWTFNNESQHLMICGVPKLQLNEEVKKLVYPYGDVKTIHIVSEYPKEEFTEAYHVQYARIQSARIAKRFIDGKNFYGGLLHVFYVPELESIAETRAKLVQRHREVAMRIKKNQQDMINPNLQTFVPKEQYHRKKKSPALPISEEHLAQRYPGETLSSICIGIPQNINPCPVLKPSLPSTSHSSQNNNSIISTILQMPYHPSEAIINTPSLYKSITKSQSDNDNYKKKNYKGQLISNKTKVRIVRPQIVDTSTIVKWDTTSEKNIFNNPKKVENKISIKLKSQTSDEKKRIVIKNSRVTQLIKPSQDLQLSIQSAKSQIRLAMETHDSKSFPS